MNRLRLGLLIALIALPLPVEAVQCPRGTVTGAVTHVRDGDTIEVGSMAIRLNGIAAPEADELGSDAATAAMRAMVHGREVRCQLNGRRTYDRCVGVCYLNGDDIEAVMVRRGLARDCPRYSGGQHGAAERQAAADGATIGQRYFAARILPGAVSAALCPPRRARLSLAPACAGSRH